MTAARGDGLLVVADAEGDRLTVERIRGYGPEAYLAVVTLPGRMASVGLNLDDGLEVLSFLADALGVERYAPGAGSPTSTPAPPDPGVEQGASGLGVVLAAVAVVVLTLLAAASFGQALERQACEKVRSVAECEVQRP